MNVLNDNPWQGLPYPSPRDWQDEARQPALQAIQNRRAGIIQAIMGAGKSCLIAEILHSLELDTDEYIVITTPSVRLVDQLYDDVTQRLPERAVGRYYTHGTNIRPVTIACMPSAGDLGRTLDYRDKECVLWICDEAHKSECDTMHDACEALEPDARIGFTATPFRAEQDEELSLDDELIYEYTASDAIQDGIVVPPKLVHYEGTMETLDRACIEMIDDVTDEGPGMANALTIESAEEFADKLNDADIAADTVHSKKGKSANDRVMQKLKNGHLDCAVHINMLAEGADFPWLRWLCMRRNVGSRTRFCQEVGRVLRDQDDKDYALILDPHDLFNSFGLDYEAVLAGDAVEKEPQQKAEDVRDKLQAEGNNLDRADGGTPVEALDVCSEWLRKVKVAMQSHGYIDDKISSTGWRTDDMSYAQGRAIKKYATLGKNLPDEHKQAARESVRAGLNGDLSKGEASDLLGILFAVQDHGWPDEIESLVE